MEQDCAGMRQCRASPNAQLKMSADGPSVEIMTCFYLKLDYLVLQIYFNGALMALSATTITVSVGLSTECLQEQVKGIS